MSLVKYQVEIFQQIPWNQVHLLSVRPKLNRNNNHRSTIKTTRYNRLEIKATGYCRLTIEATRHRYHRRSLGRCTSKKHPVYNANSCSRNGWSSFIRHIIQRNNLVAGPSSHVLSWNNAVCSFNGRFSRTRRPAMVAAIGCQQLSARSRVATDSLCSWLAQLCCLVRKQLSRSLSAPFPSLSLFLSKSFSNRQLTFLDACSWCPRW